ncbi:hypothetical protein B0H19DRAFT_1067545 [Mycena capillaripes]|nr:hypothetical protein B0H19DRAFT_1067545 [Mycena capillaripes]
MFSFRSNISAPEIAPETKGIRRRTAPVRSVPPRPAPPVSTTFLGAPKHDIFWSECNQPLRFRERDDALLVLDGTMERKRCAVAGPKLGNRGLRWEEWQAISESAQTESLGMGNSHAPGRRSIDHAVRCPKWAPAKKFHYFREEEPLQQPPSDFRPFGLPEIRPAAASITSTRTNTLASDRRLARSGVRWMRRSAAGMPKPPDLPQRYLYGSKKRSSKADRAAKIAPPDVDEKEPEDETAAITEGLGDDEDDVDDELYDSEEEWYEGGA